ncbi:MAG: 4-hydroxy-tetrahydrodipicolinate reductase [Peptoniphilaceae bacterium]|nr:4-hydroxy-tetrahydrodipicolinate reductase [Peptoniphilaceae bacterium]MDD7383657.1 4-hydroxy-tetrahydrodipicolinate reductase [Peptoniphilaceae bacterium]MDY3737828.1 4-hydroxy-tetrahydrodipicolinate reductase [Peptoniphilaceae bacterium]
MIKILLTGADGAMGKTVIQVVEENKKFEITSGISKNEILYGNFNIYDNFNKVKEKVDVVIDFSNRIILEDELNFCKKNSIPLVLATTGLTNEDFKKIDEFSKYFPILQSSNFSLGINVMEKYIKYFAKALSDFDIEIIEKHHNKKKDAPSGTAKMLFESINSSRENSLFEVYSRNENEKEREKNEVGIFSLRGGTIAGEHEVIFAGNDEVITIKHEAQSKKIFAQGALKAAEFLIEKENGIYNMKDFLK